MKSTNEYLIPFIGLKIGKHQFEYTIDKKFFDEFSFDEFENCDVKVKVVLEKKATLLEFTLTFDGTVNVSCDRTNEPFDLPIHGQYHFVVKFGEAYDDQQDDLLVLPHGSYQVNIQQFVYETIVFAVPAKRIHPGIIDGTLESEVLNKLEELSLTTEQESEQSEVDPRWDNLNNY